MNRLKKDSKILLPSDLYTYIRFLAIPFVVIVLIVVILVADRGDKDAPEGGQVADISGDPVSGSDLSDDGLYAQDFSEYELKVNDVPEIQTLMEDYYQAKLEGDAETIGRLFGKTDQDEIEAFRPTLQIYQDLVESFDNITCYYKPGLETDTYLVYVYCDIKMKEADTPGPSLVWTYVKRGSDGEYRMCDKDELTQEEKEYADKVDRSEDVRLLASQAEQILREAVMSDQNLAYYYGRLRAGADTYDPEASDGTGDGESASGDDASEEGDSESQTEAGTGAPEDAETSGAPDGQAAGDATAAG